MIRSGSSLALVLVREERLRGVADGVERVFDIPDISFLGIISSEYELSLLS